MRPNLTHEEALEVYHHLLAISNNGVLSYGDFPRFASKYNRDVSTIKRLWKRAKDRPAGQSVVDALKKKKKTHTGRRSIPMEDITTK